MFSLSPRSRTANMNGQIPEGGVLIVQWQHRRTLIARAGQDIRSCWELSERRRGGFVPPLRSVANRRRTGKRRIHGNLPIPLDRHVSESNRPDIDPAVVFAQQSERYGIRVHRRETLSRYLIDQLNRRRHLRRSLNELDDFRIPTP